MEPKKIINFTTEQSLRFMRGLNVALVLGMCLMLSAHPINDNPIPEGGTIYVDPNGKVWEFDSWEEFVHHIMVHKNDPIEIDFGDN